MKKNKTEAWKILSVGGSIIIPASGFDIEFLKKFRDMIVGEVKKGSKFILVIGGGATARQYQGAARQLGASDVQLDWIGIQSTIVNAELAKLIFGAYAHTEVVTNPTKKVKTTKKIIIAAGWKPGCSTDKDAVLLAKTYGATELVNLSNVDYVYDSDPKANPNAKKIEEINWNDFRKIVGNKWSPGANVPFDPVAAQEAQKLKLTVKFAKGNNINALDAVLGNKKILGTIIS